MPARVSSNVRSGACWPDGPQRTLLRAIVGPGDARLRAWGEFQSRHDIGALDAASNALVSLVWTSVGEEGIESPERNRIKGTWRHQWVRRQTLLATLRDLLAACGGRGIDLALLGGTAAAFADYPEGILRPWTGLHLAVRSERASDAAALLRARGWAERAVAEGAPAGSSAWAMDGATDVDLRGAIFPEAGKDATFWSRMESIVVDGKAVFVLPRAERFAWTSYESIRWMPGPPLVALVDAAMLARGMGEADRESLAAFARSARLVHSARRLAAWLDGIGAEGARGIVEALSGERASIAERVETALRDRGTGAMFAHARDWLRARRLRRW